MQTISVDVDAIIVKRRKQARLKSVLGPLFLMIALGGLVNVWTERHTLIAYPAVWALGLAIVGAGFLLEARYIFRTNNESKGYLTLAGQLVLFVGVFGTTALELANRSTGGHATELLWVLFAPAAFGLVVFLAVALYCAIRIAPLWFSHLFPRER